MKEKSFEKLVWELVKEAKPQTLVVDTYHGYAIIKDRIDSLWEQIRMEYCSQDDDENEDSQGRILMGLVALASYSQLISENLGMTPEQISKEEGDKLEEEETEEALGLARRFIHMVDREKKVTKSLQKDMIRYSFSFDSCMLDSWLSQVAE